VHFIGAMGNEYLCNVFVSGWIDILTKQNKQSKNKNNEQVVQGTYEEDRRQRP